MDESARPVLPALRPSAGVSARARVRPLRGTLVAALVAGSFLQIPHTRAADEADDVPRRNVTAPAESAREAPALPTSDAPFARPRAVERFPPDLLTDRPRRTPAADARGTPASVGPLPAWPPWADTATTTSLAADVLPPPRPPADPWTIWLPWTGVEKVRPPRTETAPSLRHEPIPLARTRSRLPSPLASPVEPPLGAALDGPAASAEPADERRLRLAEQHTWLDPDGPSRNAERLLARLADAGAHGLDPARYDLDGLRADLAAAFRPPPFAAPALDSPARAALAYRFGRAFSRLAEDLGRGLVDARSVQRRLYRDRPDPDIDALRAALVRGELDVDGALAAVAPTDERYLRLVDTTRKLLAERASGGSRTRVDEDGALRIGERHADVMRLKRRLIETGELPVDTVVTPMFDADLVVALEAFQRRHGIEPGGGSDRRTREALNRTIEDDLDDLALSLERWRWMPRALGELHVLVNLPDYRLVVDHGTRRVLDMPVVIGAIEHPTPSFSRDMSYLEFQPTWTVPASIAYRELLPRERADPGYLRSRNFDFLEYVDGTLRKVPHEAVDRAALDARPFPYVLRQRGGANNALGRMKFMMPNPYAIYLHDTPAKRHFALHERAFSHGCIRLSDPDRLATLLLQLDGRSPEETEGLIESRETRRSRLRAPVPTHLVYFTTWIDEEGDLRRRDDVYGHDPALRAALETLGALPSARLRNADPSG